MTWYGVERGVEIPPPQGGRKPVYPWVEMARGDSFFIAHEGPAAGVRGAKAVDAGRQWAKRQGRDIEFTSRSVPGGVRVWRVR